MIVQNILKMYDFFKKNYTPHCEMHNPYKRIFLPVTLTAIFSKT